LYKITVIPGDGIGEEVTQSVIQMVDSLNLPIEWEIVSAGLNTYNNTGELLPESALNSIETNRIVLKGPITTPIGYGFKSINVTLRTKYNLYANIRPVKI
jgi:Isocitrate/isopropylmalate dehydrogenase